MYDEDFLRAALENERELAIKAEMQALNARLRALLHERLTNYLLAVQAGKNPAGDGVVHRSEIVDLLLGPEVT